jgi:hypothetical protein
MFFRREKKEKEPVPVKTYTVDITKFVDMARNTMFKPQYAYDSKYTFSIGKLYFTVAVSGRRQGIAYIKVFTLADVEGLAETIVEFGSMDADPELLDEFYKIMMMRYRAAEHQKTIDGFARFSSMLESNANAN